MLTKPEPCEFANDLFIFSANPEMLEELRTEVELDQFHDHLSQEPLCPYCQSNARPLMEFFAGIAASGATAEELMRGLTRTGNVGEGDRVLSMKHSTKPDNGVRLSLAARTDGGDSPRDSLHRLDDGQVTIGRASYTFAQDDRKRIFLLGPVPADVSGIIFGNDEQPYALRRSAEGGEPAYEVVGMTLGVLRDLFSERSDEAPEIRFVME